MASYLALLRKDKGSDYGVEFPDLPGCITAGSSLEEAQAMAEEALAAHVVLLREDGDPVPAPSSLDMIAALPVFKGAVAMVVELKEVADRAVRINITVPERALAVIDRAAEREGMNRSAYLARAAESIANGEQVTSDAEFKQWAQEHLAKGRPTGAYVISTWVSGSPMTPTEVRQKLERYVVKRDAATGAYRSARSVPERVAKAGKKSGIPLSARRRTS